MPSTILRVSTLAYLFIACTGCGEDTAIRSYSVAKNSGSGSSAGAADTAGVADKPAQLLGVIVPHQESAWFLKMTDEPEKVQKLTDDFRNLASSLTFSQDGTPEWSLADGWQQKVLKQITYAQFSNADGATVTLTQLGANTADATQWQTYLKDNINRWRQQLGLDPQEWSSIEQELEEVPTHSTETAKAYFVSLIGRQSAAAGGAMRAVPPMMGPSPESRPQSSTLPTKESSESAKPRLTYQVPESWQEQPSSGIRLASFQIPAEPEMGTLVVAVAGGQLEQSIAMWMQQVGLEPEESRVKKVMENAVQASSLLGEYSCFSVEGSTPQAEGGKSVAIRVAVIPLNDRESLFVKMTGTKALIAAQLEKFDQFVQSLRMQ